MQFRVWLIKFTRALLQTWACSLKARVKMALTANYVLFLSLLSSLSIPVTSQDCSLPDGAMINTTLRSLLISRTGEGDTLVTTLLDHHFTCLAVGSSRDLYRHVSVAVRYTKNTASEQLTAQFPLRCTAGNFDTVGELDQSPPANVFDISTRRDCFTCTTVGSHPSFTIDAVADCACKCYNFFCTFTGKCKLSLYMHSMWQLLSDDGSRWLCDLSY